MPAQSNTSKSMPEADPPSPYLASEAPLLQKLRDQTEEVVERLRPQIDTVADFARNDPAKAMLASAAVGAALMGLLALMMRSGKRTVEVPVPRSLPKMSTLASIRDSALDLADRAQSAASAALASTQSAYSATKTAFADTKSAMAEKQKQATSAADSASDAVTDAWQSIREQAEPVIDRLRPQIDAVTAYAKDEPAKTALGVAAAGAVLLGLLSLVSGSDDD